MNVSKIGCCFQRCCCLQGRTPCFYRRSGPASLLAFSVLGFAGQGGLGHGQPVPPPVLNCVGGPLGRLGAVSGSTGQCGTPEGSQVVFLLTLRDRKINSTVSSQLDKDPSLAGDY